MLRVSALNSVEENVACLLAHLKGNAPMSTSLPPVDVYLCHATPQEVNRDAIIKHVEALYNASTSFSIASRIDVIPVVSCASAALLPVGSSLMTAATGFAPLYDYIAVGGTFDRLHAGHKLLLTVSSLYASKKLRIGITGEVLLKNKKFAELVETFDERKENVKKFMEKIRGEDLELEIDRILDFSGGTDRIPDVQALVASPETMAAVPKINAIRRENGLKDLEAIPIHFVGGNEPSVSSSKLRELCNSK